MTIKNLCNIFLTYKERGGENETFFDAVLANFGIYKRK